MAINQLLYTSCRTGITNQGSGFQFYAYSEAVHPADIKYIQQRFCGYTPPSNAPLRPTQEEIMTVFPRNFAFGPGSERGDRYCLAQSVYTCYDYVGETGRTGVFLSHIFSFTPTDLSAHPATYYLSSAFVAQLAPEELNASEPPLPLPSLATIPENETICWKNVAIFLDEQRMPVFRQMLAALFAEKRKRILLLDEPEHIALWIAALQMTLPVRNAYDIPFSTFEYSPALSKSRLCGVLREGTDYRPSHDNQNDTFFVFDFEARVYPTPIPEDPFLGFVEVGVSASKVTLLKFHEFLNETSYCLADAQIYAAFAAFRFLCDSETVDAAGMRIALGFLDSYASQLQQTATIEKLLHYLEDDVLVNISVLHVILEVLAKMHPKMTVKQVERFTLFVPRAFLTLFSQLRGNEATEFHARYTEALQKRGLHIDNLVLGSYSLLDLCGLLNDDVAKLAYVLRLTSQVYQNPSLSKQREQGDLAGVLEHAAMVISSFSEHDAEQALSLAATSFADNEELLVFATMYLEVAVRGKVPAQVSQTVWSNLYKLAVRDKKTLQRVQKNLIDAKRFDCINDLFKEQLTRASKSEKEQVFFTHCQSVLKTSQEYAALYRDKVFNQYLATLTILPDKERKAYERSLLLHILGDKHAAVSMSDIINKLVVSVADQMPLYSPGSEDAFLATKIWNAGAKLPQRTRLLLAGLSLNPINRLDFLALVENEPLKLSFDDGRQMKGYLSWLVANLCVTRYSSNDMVQILSGFSFAESDTACSLVEIYVATCCSNSLFNTVGVLVEACYYVQTEAFDKGIIHAVQNLSDKQRVTLERAVSSRLKDKKVLTYWKNLLKQAPRLNLVQRMLRPFK